MTIPEIVSSLNLQTYEYCNKQKIIQSKDSQTTPQKLNEIMIISETLDSEQISYTIDPQSNFINLFDNKI
ncbi:MAG: hypothetical protein OIF32_08685 [Campylobacterales bacterium]|nr:hypothetical protein [Campylobacterales bacterium]